MGGLGSKTIRNPQPNKNTEIQLFLQKKFDQNSGQHQYADIGVKKSDFTILFAKKLPILQNADTS